MSTKTIAIISMLAAVISAIIAVLLYFDIKPSDFLYEDNKASNDVIISEQSLSKDSNQDSVNYPIAIKEENTNHKNNTSNDETYLEKSKLKDKHDYKTWEEMTKWDVVLLPFIKHEKKDYATFLRDEYGSILIIALIYGSIFWFFFSIIFLFDIFDEISDKVAHIALLSPAGQDTMADLHNDGGIPAVLKTIESKFFKI